eukprot:4191511-Heterocapsa_arctica.AAC.1
MRGKGKQSSQRRCRPGPGGQGRASPERTSDARFMWMSCRGDTPEVGPTAYASSMVKGLAI